MVLGVDDVPDGSAHLDRLARQLRRVHHHYARRGNHEARVTASELSRGEYVLGYLLHCMPPCPGRIRSTLTPRLVEYHSLCCLLTVRIWQENVPDKTFKLTGGRQELPQRATGGAESQEFFGGQPVVVVRAAKVRQLGVQLRDDIGVDRLVYARHRFDPTLVQPDLPAERRRDYDVSADQLAPVHMIAERRRKQPRAKSLLPV